MDSLSSVSPSIVLPLRRHQYHHRRRQSALSFTSKKSFNKLFVLREFYRRNLNLEVYCKSRGRGEDDDKDRENERKDEELERAMRMDGTIPGTSDAFVKQVSSRAYDMRRHLQQSFDSSSYDCCRLAALKYMGSSRLRARVAPALAGVLWVPGLEGAYQEAFLRGPLC